LVREFVGLLCQEQLECSFGQPARGRSGDLLEGAEIDIQTRSVISEGALGNNLCPSCRQIVQFLEFLGAKVWGGHRLSCLEVAT
jgi:hypothetical protein